MTSYPSPVYVEKFKISFSNCITGVYEFTVGATIPQNTDTQIPIQPITVKMKEDLLNQNPNIVNSICDAIANIEFSLVEQYSGKRKTYSYPINVRITDCKEMDECL